MTFSAPLALRLRDDTPFCFEQIFRIEHRKLPGTTVPFIFNEGQTAGWAEIRRMLALNLRMEIDAARSGQGSYIKDLLARVDSRLPIYDYEIGLRLLKGKSRRVGFSTFFVALGMQRCNFVPSYSGLLMSHDQKGTEEIFRIARKLYEDWPEEFKEYRFAAKYDQQEKFELINGSRIAIKTAGVRGKRESTRGWKFDFYHFSEYAHFQSYKDAKACASVAEPYAWVLKESTGKGASGPFYNEWQRALTVDEAEEAYERKDAEVLRRWGTPKHQYKSFFPWLDDPLCEAPVYDWEAESLERLDEYETAVRQQFPKKFTARKVKWRRAAIATECQEHPDLEPAAFFAQEYPTTDNEMFQTTGSAIFPREPLDLMELKARESGPILQLRLDGKSPPEKRLLGGANTLFYKRPEPRHSYLIGADVAQGLRERHDFSWCIVLDQHDGTFFEEVASFWSRSVDAKAYGHVITLLAELYNQAFITPEIQGGGLATAMTIVNDNRYHRIYHRQTLDMVHGAGDGNIFRYGIYTSRQVKDALIQNMVWAIRERRVLLRTPELIRQFKNFQRFDGELRAPDGEHDDGVMATGMGMFGARWAGPIDRPSADRAIVMDTSARAASDRSLLRAITDKKARDSRRAAKTGGRPAVDDKERKRVRVVH